MLIKILITYNLVLKYKLQPLVSDMYTVDRCTRTHGFSFLRICKRLQHCHCCSLIMHTITSLLASAWPHTAAFHMNGRCQINASPSRSPPPTRVAALCCVSTSLTLAVSPTNLLSSFDSTCAPLFSCSFSVLCNLHNFVLFSSDWVQDGHDPWPSSCHISHCGFFNLEDNFQSTHPQYAHVNGNKHVNVCQLSSNA